MSTSVAYLRKRLNDIERHDLLAAVEAGHISTFAAAEEAGLIKRPPVGGNGSENQAKKRAWAIMKATGRGPTLAPKPGPTPPKPGPEIRAAQPKFSQETRDTIARLVEAGRADLLIAVTERRISPFQAARIADRGAHRIVVSESNQKARQAEPEAPKVRQAEPEAKKIDVRALIA